MSTVTQVNKNIRLSNKLAKYFVKNPKKITNYPSNVSFVIISANDKTLNIVNEKLIKNLKKSGKKVVKAKETKNTSSPWQFNYA